MPKVLSIDAFRREVEKSMTEEQVQNEIINRLTQLKYITLQTTHRVKMVTCPNTRCGHRFYPAGSYGSSYGVPDLLVSSKSWNPDGIWLGLEVKNKKGKLSKTQQDLLDLGRIVIVRSAEEAVECVREFERLNNLRGG
jgi:hypothetical protein